MFPENPVFLPPVPIHKGVVSFCLEGKMMNALSSGVAKGGILATQEALLLWAKCAEGGADYSILPDNDPVLFVKLRVAKAAFEAAVELLGQWNNERVPELQERWAKSARKILRKASGKLLKVCREVERRNSANATFIEQSNDSFTFSWRGHFTRTRMLDVFISFSPALQVEAYWDTATGAESTYMRLPSMTDEAESGSGREEGWRTRSPLI